MATIDLGKIKFNWRNEYAANQTYVPDDCVFYTDGTVTSSYICKTTSTGNAPSSGGTLHGSWDYLAKGQATSLVVVKLKLFPIPVNPYTSLPANPVKFAPDP